MQESAGRVLKLPELFGPEERDLSIGQIAERLALRKSSAHRLAMRTGF